MMFKNSELFTNCISEIKNTQVDNVNGLNVVMWFQCIICWNIVITIFGATGKD